VVNLSTASDDDLNPELSGFLAPQGPYNKPCGALSCLRIDFPNPTKNKPGFSISHLSFLIFHLKPRRGTLRSESRFEWPTQKMKNVTWKICLLLT
jgi:hypothetical protein